VCRSGGHYLRSFHGRNPEARPHGAGGFPNRAGQSGGGFAVAARNKPLPIDAALDRRAGGVSAPVPGTNEQRARKRSFGSSAESSRREVANSVKLEDHDGRVPGRDARRIRAHGQSSGGATPLAPRKRLELLAGGDGRDAESPIAGHRLQHRQDRGRKASRDLRRGFRGSG